MMSPGQPPKKKGLPWWATLLIIFAVLALLGGLLIGGAVWWIAANKDRILAESKQSVTDGMAYAANNDQSACVAEGLRKLDGCPGIMCEAQIKVFAATCVRQAKKTPGFCNGVPDATEILKTSRWIMEECSRRGKPGNQRCTRLVQVVPEACRLQ